MTTDDIQSKMKYAVSQFSRKGKLNSRQIDFARSFLQHPCTNSRKTNISNSRIKTKKQKCEHCEKLCDPGNFKQYHGNNCKYNPNVDKNVLKIISERNSKSVKKSIKTGTFYYQQLINEEPIVCPHCDFVGKNKLSMKQFHFENCSKLTGIKHSSIKQKLIECSKCLRTIDSANFDRHICKNNSALFFCE